MPSGMRLLKNPRMSAFAAARNLYGLTPRETLRDKAVVDISGRESTATTNRVPTHHGKISPEYEVQRSHAEVSLSRRTGLSPYIADIAAVQRLVSGFHRPTSGRPTQARNSSLCRHRQGAPPAHIQPHQTMLLFTSRYQRRREITFVRQICLVYFTEEGTATDHLHAHHTSSLSYLPGSSHFSRRTPAAASTGRAQRLAALVGDEPWSY